MSSITGLISGGGGGGLAPNQWTLDTIPFFYTYANRIESPIGYGSSSTNFFDTDTSDRDIASSPSCFYGTKGTGWTTVYNHTGSGAFFWFISTTFGNAAGTLIVRLTVDGQVRQLQQTQSISTADYVRLCVGSFSTRPSSTYDERSLIYSQPSQRVNNDWATPNASVVAPFSNSGALAVRFPYLKYETDLKIEVYNSNSTGGNAGNYYGGMVIQGY